MSGRHTRCESAAQPTDPEQTGRGSRVRPCAGDNAGFNARLTIDATRDQRRRIKIAAFRRGQTVADMLREIFAREFPDTLGDHS